MVFASLQGGHTENSLCRKVRLGSRAGFPKIGRQTQHRRCRRVHTVKVPIVMQVGLDLARNADHFVKLGERLHVLGKVWLACRRGKLGQAQDNRVIKDGAGAAGEPGFQRADFRDAVVLEDFRHKQDIAGRGRPFERETAMTVAQIPHGRRPREPSRQFFGFGTRLLMAGKRLDEKPSFAGGETTIGVELGTPQQRSDRRPGRQRRKDSPHHSLNTRVHRRFAGTGDIQVKHAGV